MVFLVSAVMFLAKNLTAFLIVGSVIEGYMLIASTDSIVISSLLNSSYPSLSFRLDAWKIETRDYFTFALSNILSPPKIADLGKCCGKFCHWDYQPGWESPFPIYCLVVFD